MSVWDDVHAIDEFLCVDLKAGSIIIAVLGIGYGLVGFVLFLSFLINSSEWRVLYEKKTDELAYFVFIFLIISIIFIASCILLVGVLREHDSLILIYLWCASAHVVLNFVFNLCFSFYCVWTNSCFVYKPQGSSIVLMAVTLFYSIIWIYFIVTVNSFRIDNI